MNATKLFSSTEQTILVVLALLICLTFYRDLSTKIIDSYNEGVRIEQLRQLNDANGGEEFYFTIYDGTPSLSLTGTFINLQFIFSPVLILLVSSARPGRFIFSLLMNSLTFLSYLATVINAYQSRKFNESCFNPDWDFGTYLFPHLTSLQQWAFVFVSFLLVLQVFILARFVLEKLSSGKTSLA